MCYHISINSISAVKDHREDGMVILIDMDDTIEQLLKAWLRAIEDRYGCRVCYDDVRSWDLSEPYPSLTREQIYAIPDEPGFWGTVEPIEGAADAILRLMDAGHEVYIVTATTYMSVREKMEDLLFRWFPFISWEQVIITGNKQLIKGDVLIDDGIHNLEGGDYVKVLMTAPYNRGYDAEGNGMIRVNNWTEIEAVIAELSAKKGDRDR